MAASISAEQVLEQIVESDNESLSDSMPPIEERLRSALSTVITGEEFEKSSFLSACMPFLVSQHSVFMRNTSATTSGCEYYIAARLLDNHRVKTSNVLKDGSLFWLKAINRRLSQGHGSRNPFRGVVVRDVPAKIVNAFLLVVRAMEGFREPFCCYSNNRTSETIRLTSIRLVKELFCLVSGLRESEVMSYFKRILASGPRKGHKVWLIVTDIKDFTFTYKTSQGKLIISFNFGEWNVNGFAQHS